MKAFMQFAASSCVLVTVLLITCAGSARASTNVISPGQTLSGRISNPAQTNWYAFDATADDVIYLTLLITNEPGTGPHFYLVDPDGELYANSISYGANLAYGD